MSLPKEITLPTKKQMRPGEYRQGDGCGCILYWANQIDSPMDWTVHQAILEESRAQAAKNRTTPIHEYGVAATPTNVDRMHRLFRGVLRSLGYTIRGRKAFLKA